MGARETMAQELTRLNNPQVLARIKKWLTGANDCN